MVREGIGNSGDDGWWKQLRGATGLGMSVNVRPAYAQCCQRYRDGDELYSFGFSRRADAVQSVAGA